MSEAITLSAADRDVLPSHVKPSHYRLRIHSLELGGRFSYHGEVIISVEILQSTKEIVLNAHQLSISHAEFEGREASAITYDEPRQRVTITFDDEIPVKKDASLKLEFQGTINNTMAGFYRSKYKPTGTPAASVPMDGDSHVMFSTQFESCDARRAFPCFDEPNLKATFDIGVETPTDQVALSNMPVKHIDKSSKEGFQEVWFETTPIMSTYLVAWAIGDFEYVEAFTEREYNGKPLSVRVYTTRGLKSQAQYALDHAPKIIDYFSDIFDIDYPLPKADLLAVHEFSHGAMENWGLVTYRTTAVLFDEETSDAKYKNRVAYVVAHELAHQWFGNLVTMDWWNELWLNEGFATWVGWLAVDKIHPDWNVWAQFVVEGVTTALSLDSLRSSHPIDMPVNDALEVDQIFDAISYLKGSASIIMLAADLGQENFLRGVSSYLKKHSYGNATTNDLWRSLSEASGKDVAGLMEPWIRKIGFPLVTVTEEGEGKLGFKQSRYLTTSDVKPEENTTIWPIPIGLVGKEEVSLTSKEDSVTGVDYSFYKVNKDTTGFYRTKYPPGRLAIIATQLDRLSLSDKIGLIGDAAALAESGEAETSDLLALLTGFTNESNYVVWQQILSSLATVTSVFSDDTTISKGLNKFVIKLISPAVEKIGWESSPSDDILTSQLRDALIITAGKHGHGEVVAEAQRRFKLHQSGDSTAINSNLRSAIFTTVIRHGGIDEYNALVKEMELGASIDGRELFLGALGWIQDPALLPAFLEFLTTRVPLQDVPFAMLSLGSNAKTRAGLWQYIQDNYTELFEQLSKTMVVWERSIQYGLRRFTDLEIEKEITSFFADKDVRGYDRALGIVSDTIKGRAAYKSRDSASLSKWLQENGYAA